MIIHQFSDLSRQTCLICGQYLLDFNRFIDGADFKCEQDHYYYFADTEYDYYSVEIYLPHFTIFYDNNCDNITILDIHDIYNEIINLPFTPLDFSDIPQLETKIQKLINFL